MERARVMEKCGSGFWCSVTQSVTPRAHTPGMNGTGRVYGHMHMGVVKMLKQKNMVSGMDVNEGIKASNQCESCIKVLSVDKLKGKHQGGVVELVPRDSFNII